MFALKSVLLNKGIQLGSTMSRFYALLHEQELTVIPFCNININLPFNVAMVPLDVHKYHNSDKVIIKLTSETENSPTKLQCTQDNENVNISCDSKDFVPSIMCNIEAPIKANVNLATEKGNVSLSNFNGEKITLNTTSGNIAASKCYCEKISINSSTGDITCKSVMQAGEIYLKTGMSGSITTGRLQGLVLKAETKNGTIKTESSYCNESSFITETGHLDLRSAHKNCKVVVTKTGILNMTGFDGTLQALINEGDADIQLSRIHNDTALKIVGKGTLKLKVFKWCLENTNFKIISENILVDEDLHQKTSSANGYTFLNSKNVANPNVLVDCQKSIVIVQTASLMEMFNIKLP